jgi:CheY-like chemotaxis protein
MSEVKHSALIVDDNWYNRDVFRIALENAGYTVAQAENGQEGLDCLAARTYNLLVLDLQMPGIDGTTVLKQIRGQDQHKTMRVVVVTANPHMATHEVDDLADHVMQKPIDVVSFARFTQRLKSVAEPIP